MGVKEDYAVDLLARIRMDRIAVENSERSTIPAALRRGMSVERIAHLTGATVVRVEEIRKEVEHGTG